MVPGSFCTVVPPGASDPVVNLLLCSSSPVEREKEERGRFTQHQIHCTSSLTVVLTCWLVFIGTIAILINSVCRAEVCLLSNDVCSWWVIIGGHSTFCPRAFPWQRRSVLQPPADGRYATWLSLNAVILFLAEGNVPLCCMFLESSLAVWTLDVVWVWSRWFWWR